jgi:hypothetical protein
MLVEALRKAVNMDTLFFVICGAGAVMLGLAVVAQPLKTKIWKWRVANIEKEEGILK